MGHKCVILLFSRLELRIILGSTQKIDPFFLIHDSKSSKYVVDSDWYRKKAEISNLFRYQFQYDWWPLHLQSQRRGFDLQSVPR